MKRPVIVVVLAALQAALAASAGAQELGRLFFSPEQRDALDARRKARVFDKPAAAPVVASPTTRLDGFVRRSDGNSTVWINGESFREGAPADGVRIERSDRVGVAIGDDGDRVKLRPGEVLDRGTGEVRDVIGGELKVRRPAK